jgi:hypothetical protein
MAKFRRSWNKQNVAKNPAKEGTKEWGEETAETKCAKCVSAGKTKCECQAEEWSGAEETTETPDD